jgi:hypothetical protein
MVPFISGASVWRGWRPGPSLAGRRRRPQLVAIGAPDNGPLACVVERSWPCPVPLEREEEEITDMWGPHKNVGPTATSGKTTVETSEGPKMNGFGN